MIKLMEKINAYCNICEKRTDWDYIGEMRDFNNRDDYYMYNCQECEGTRCLQSLIYEQLPRVINNNGKKVILRN